MFVLMVRMLRDDVVVACVCDVVIVLVYDVDVSVAYVIVC